MLNRSIRTNVPSMVLALSAVAAVVFSANWSHAATRSQAQKDAVAAELVREALHREVFGLTAERDELLREAAELSPSCEPAMWHRGFVQYKGEWIKAVDLPQILDEDPRVAQYLKFRDGHEDTVDGQLAIAEWCRKRGLVEQERAHLTRVIELSPDHVEARTRLGFRRIDDRWLATEEVRESLDAMHEGRKSLAEWQPTMERILKGLHQRSELKRNAATAQLLEIMNPSAIAAMEAMLSNDSEATAQLVVQAIGQMPENEASLALARQAIFSPWTTVRDAAAKQLQERPEDGYVPSFLATLYTPAESRFLVSRGQGGRIMYRHAFVREGQDENQLLVLDTEYRRVRRAGGSAEDSLERALDNARRSLATRELNLAAQNQQTVEMNKRIMSALSIATGQQLPATPEAWWDWWTQHNEVFSDGQKQTNAIARAETVSIVDRVPTGGGQGTGGGHVTMDCLAAGTEVWTAAGPVAIDKIRVGDLVLAQDVESGELAYKPVLRTTVRPKSTLVQIVASNETVQSSGGHPFFVSGEGWVKARDLKPGMELHGVGTTVRVQSVERVHAEETYNLIVADFNTYFVGDSKVLSHDNTVRESTDAIVPGMAD